MVQYWLVLNLDKRETLGQESWGEMRDIMLSGTPESLVYQLSQSWAGNRIVVVSDYALTYPDGMLTTKERDEVEDMYLEEEEYDDEDPAPTLYEFAEEWYKAVPVEIRSEGVKYLRNLNKKEYVRSDVIWEKCPAGIKEKGAKNGLGHAVMVLACWTNETEDIGGEKIGGGRWAGDRLEMVESFEVTQGWRDIMLSDSLTTGKATLIIVKDEELDITLDHIAFVDSQSTQLVTLSGLRAQIQTSSKTLSFRSSIHPDSKLFHSLKLPSTRSRSFTLLPPLPSDTNSSYPSFSILPHAPHILIPLRTKPPPLPPRPTSHANRIPHPFASLFGVGGSPASSSPPPERTSTPPPSLPTSNANTITVPVLLIDKRIIRHDIARAINSTITSEIAHALTSKGTGEYDIPEWVSDRVHEFALGAGMYPFVKEKPQAESPGTINKRLEVAIAGRGAVLRHEREHGTATDSDDGDVHAVSKWAEEPERLAQLIQDFYSSLEKEARDRRARSGFSNEEQYQQETDSLVGRIVESSEAVLTRIFYDRLFIQPTSDDGSHDETLSSRTAALNMLDLTLQHLDIDVNEDDHATVTALVQSCGEKLTQLQTLHTPKEKSTALVTAHKLIVDGLSTLTSPLKLITPESKTTTKDSKSTSNSESTSTPIVSSDVLLPFLIFSVVKSNPPHLVSHLLFTQRFRSIHSSSTPNGGEESYCLINLMAVAEFLENVDLEALGLGSGLGVDVMAPPSPIFEVRAGMTFPPPPAITPTTTATIVTTATGGETLGAGLRDRVEQQVDAIAVSANKVLTGVMDTSFGMLKSLLPQGQGPKVKPKSVASMAVQAIGVGSGPLKRMIENPEEGQQMVDVVRVEEASVDEGEGEGGGEEGEEDGEGEGEGGGEDRDGEDQTIQQGSVRSIKSFESMMSERSGGSVKSRLSKGVDVLRNVGGGQRKSLSDRLANMSALAGIKGSPPPVSRRSSWMPSSRPATPADGSTGMRIAPPVQRFLECSSEDLRIGEVAELLKEYRRLVEAVRVVGGFSTELEEY